MTQYQYPFPLDTITTDFGAVDSEHPNPHRGTDFAPGGLPIPAVSDGVVVRDERQSGLGNVVTVRADDGIFWACSHMADRTPFNVGDRVARGDTVGVVGNTDGQAVNVSDIVNETSFLAYSAGTAAATAIHFQWAAVSEL